MPDGFEDEQEISDREQQAWEERRYYEQEAEIARQREEDRCMEWWMAKVEDDSEAALALLVANLPGPVFRQAILSAWTDDSLAHWEALHDPS